MEPYSRNSGLADAATHAEAREMTKEHRGGPIIFGLAAASLSGATVGFFIAGAVGPALMLTAGVIAGALMGWYARGLASAK
ncbi:MAG: hypothetical protein AB7K04_03480 [Pseudorhodoplanes sp.]